MGVWVSNVSIILVAAAALHASIAGIVRDADTGAPLPGAAVSLIDVERATATDADGRYALRDVPAGPQHVVVQRIGYAPQTFHALVPPDGAVEINVALQPAPIEIEAIDVGAPVPVRGLDDAEGAAPSDRAVSLASIRNHPLAAEPDAFRALGGGEVAIRPESPSGLHVRGGASDQVAYVLDGIPVFSPYHSSGTFSAWNPDALSRLELYSSSPRADLPDALCGAVAGTTRAPGARHSSQGSVSTTQARVALDGPIGRAGAGYAASFRSAFPGLLVRRDEASYVSGESLDWIWKAEAPLFGGRMRVLGSGGENEVDAAAIAGSGGASESDRTRNLLAWDNRSAGIGWTRRGARGAFEFRAWGAAANAGATWTGADSLADRLASRRRDAGAVALAEFGGARARTVAGLRAERSRTTYSIAPLPNDESALALNVRTPLAAAFVEHSRPLTARSTIAASLANVWAAGELHASPSAKLSWSPSPATTLSGTYARRFQFAQSLRNSESAAGNIFPADLFVGAGAGGVPVARSHVGGVAVDHRPRAGVRIGAQAYARDFDALALVAPSNSEPFAIGGFVDGEGEAYGASIEAAANGARYALLASYGYQHVRLSYADSSYVPEYGAHHTLEGGVILFPSPTSDIRIGFETALGRRGTAGLGFLEWEACNLLDQGCEFAGNLGERSEALGSTRLPTYLRLDLGVRKHWHVHAGGRDAQIALFGTMTNLLNRPNVLTIAVNPETGERSRVEMRPLSPLVVGLDWRF